MKIMITGAKGQLGNELTGILSSGASEIGRADSAYDGCEWVAVDVDELDITDTSAVLGFVAKERPQMIINCAAMTNVDACETNHAAAMKVNAIGARNLAMAAEEAEAVLLHVSTDYVFAGDGTVPYVEWDLCNPQSIYGKSKRLGEEYVLNLCSRSFVVRTAWLYGYEGGNFVKTILRVAREKGTLQVVNDQRGNPTNAGDLAHHLLKLGLTEEYGIYHCTGEGECSWYDFACKIVEYAGIPCTVNPCTTEEFPRPARRPAYSSLRNLMLECTVGNEMRRWEDALAAYIAGLRQRKLLD